MLSFAACVACAQDAALERGQIALTPGERYEWILDYSVNVPKSDRCPPLGPPLALHAFGNVPQWGCKAITNRGDTIGIWRVDFGKTGGEGLRLVLQRGAGETTILTAPKRRTMAMKESAGPWLASLPFAIAPKETVVLWTEISPWTALRVDPFLSWAHLVPEEDYAQGITQRGFAVASLLTASALLILFLTTFARLLGSRPARDYAIYFTTATAAFIAAEAYLAWVFPNVPVLWAAVPAKPLEIAVFVLYYRFVASFTRTALGDHGVVRRYRAMAWTALGIFLVAMLLNAAGMTLLTLPDALLTPLVGGALPPGLAAFAEWAAFRSPEIFWLGVGLLSAAYAAWAVVALLRARADGAMLFALGAGVIIVLYYLPYVQGLDGLERAQGFWVTRGMIVADGLVFAAALIQQTFGLREQRDAALQAELAASQERLTMAENLLAAKAGRAQAEAMAERHREKLALTSHDLRQPLTSLQLAVADAQAAAPGLGDKLASGIDYLKQVLDETVVEARPADLTTDAHTPGSDLEPTPVALLLQNVERMFGDEARAKGLELVVTPSEAVVATQPVAMIRILSNLVSNAIKYTESGSVRIGLRPDGADLAIEVADTGPGLTQAETQAILRAYDRGAATDTAGEGIGLTSVQQMAEELGLRLKIDSKKGQGARFSITGLRMASETA